MGLAHRGGAAYGPNVGVENTLAAFRRAVELGYRYVETDVHATSDGVLLAFHDTVLDRVTDGMGPVAAQPYAAIRSLRVGGAEPIPRLDDLLEELPTTRFNVDVKAASAIAPLVAVLRSHRAVDRVCVGSFSERRLHAVRRAVGPALATAAGPLGTAALARGPRRLPPWLTTPAPVLQVPETMTVAGRAVRVVSPGFVEHAHRLGKHVHVWTVDERADMERLLDWGVDGIVSDRIDVLRDVLAARALP